MRSVCQNEVKKITNGWNEIEMVFGKRDKSVRKDT